MDLISTCRELLLDPHEPFAQQYPQRAFEPLLRSIRNLLAELPAEEQPAFLQWLLSPGSSALAERSLETNPSDSEKQEQEFHWNSLRQRWMYAAYTRPSAFLEKYFSEIDYQIPEPPGSEQDPLEAHEPGELPSDVDVVIIGSGAGGSVVADLVARAGYSVVVLEQGPWIKRSHLGSSEFEGNRKLTLKDFRVSPAKRAPLVLAGTGVGGGTTINWSTCLMPPEKLLDDWAKRTGIPTIADGTLQRHCGTVAHRLGLTTDDQNANRNNQLLRQGCLELGWQCTQIARNVAHCHQCDFCTFGCRTGTKQDTRTTFLHDAVQAQAMVAAGAQVEAIAQNHDATWEVSIHPTGEASTSHPLAVRARRVVVAAGAIHSPAILMRSGHQHPELGRNLHVHPASIFLSEDRQPVLPWKGPPQSFVCDEFATQREAGSEFRIECAPMHPGLAAIAIPDRDPEIHRSLMKRLPHLANTLVLVRDRDGGRVKLDSKHRVKVDYQTSARDLESLRDGLDKSAEIHKAAGLRPLAHSQTDHRVGEPKIFSAHQMSTCRMNSDSKQGVVNGQGQVLDMPGVYISDASLFPTASGVNPMLTVMGLARMVAEHVVEDLAVGPA